MKQKTVKASDVRNNFSQIISEAHYGNQSIIVEKMKKPFVVVLSYEEYLRLKKARESSFEVFDRIRAKNTRVKLEEVEKDVKEAIKAVRKK